MEVFEGTGINSVYTYVLDELVAHGDDVPVGRPGAVDGMTKEIHPCILHLSNPTERLVTATGRVINVPFALAEVLWILSGRKDVAMLQYYNGTIGQFSDNGEDFNAAYGYRLRQSFGHDQIEDCIRTLMDDSTSRQATLVISNPVDDRGWDRSPGAEDPTEFSYSKRVVKDRACNLMSHMLVRDGALHWTQVLRSNDLIWGTPFNIMQFTHLQEYIAGRLGVAMGSYTHVAHSLHMYSHHWQDAEQIKHFDLYKELGGLDHAPMQTTDEALNIVMREEEVMRTHGPHALVVTKQMLNQIGTYWYNVLLVLQAFGYYKQGEDLEALRTLRLCDDDVLALSTLRFMCHNRWYKQEHTDVLLRSQDHAISVGTSKVAEWLVSSRRAESTP